MGARPSAEEVKIGLEYLRTEPLKEYEEQKAEKKRRKRPRRKRLRKQAGMPKQKPQPRASGAGQTAMEESGGWDDGGRGRSWQRKG